MKGDNGYCLNSERILKTMRMKVWSNNYRAVFYGTSMRSRRNWMKLGEEGDGNGRMRMKGLMMTKRFLDETKMMMMMTSDGAERDVHEQKLCSFVIWASCQ